MIQGLYTAANGMLVMEERQSAVANNIANASTVAFKSHSPVQLGFYDIFSNKLRHPANFDSVSAPAGGVKIVETYSDLARGIMQRTDNPLSMGLEGPGYFAVDTPWGERYTRNGDFTADTEGMLVTQNGFRVQSVSGQPIDVRGNEINIDEKGVVSVDGTLSGQLRVVEFEEPQRLERTGSNLYKASEEIRRGVSEAANTPIAQRLLEMSNVSIPREMMKMMIGMRSYEANQRVVQSVDGTLGKLIDLVGMP